MSAPGLDLQLVELTGASQACLAKLGQFYGLLCSCACLKDQPTQFVRADQQAKVLIVCTELCTLHFQRESTVDNIASSLSVWRR